MKVANKALIQDSVSSPFNLLKHRAVNPSKHLIARQSSHKEQAPPISNGRLGLCLFDSFPNNLKLQLEIRGDQAGGPVVTKLSRASCISRMESSLIADSPGFCEYIWLELVYTLYNILIYLPQCNQYIFLHNGQIQQRKTRTLGPGMQADSLVN